MRILEHPLEKNSIIDQFISSPLRSGSLVKIAMDQLGDSTVPIDVHAVTPTDQHDTCPSTPLSAQPESPTNIASSQLPAFTFPGPVTVAQPVKLSELLAPSAIATSINASEVIDKTKMIGMFQPFVPGLKIDEDQLGKIASVGNDLSSVGETLEKLIPELKPYLNAPVLAIGLVASGADFAKALHDGSAAKATLKGAQFGMQAIESIADIAAFTGLLPKASADGVHTVALLVKLATKVVMIATDDLHPEQKHSAVSTLNRLVAK